MESPEKMIESWRKLIKEEKDVNMLQVMKSDMEMEKEDYESWAMNMDELIDDVIKKIEKQSRNFAKGNFSKGKGF